MRWINFFGNYRFTPTRVGITNFERDAITGKSVHPHTRGDHPFGSEQPTTNPGSPPHAWGSLELGFVEKLLRRFTPTRVGITTDSPARTADIAVHPHTRGDHSLVIW